MFIPSLRIRHLITRTTGGVWFEEMEEPSTDCLVALVIKVETPIVKAVYLGCNVRLRIGRVVFDDSNILCLAVEFSDIPEDPYYLFRVVNNERDTALLHNLLSSEKNIWIHFFDDTSTHSLSSCYLLDTVQARLALGKITDLKHPSTVDDNIDVDRALDAFEHNCSQGNSEPSEEVQSVNLSPINHHVIEVSTPEIFGSNKQGTRVDNTDEGGGFEQQAYRLLFDIFESWAIRSPILADHPLQRELTDVLVVKDDLLLAFECKASAVITRENVASAGKRAKLIRKQLSKAFAQLQGVARQLRRAPRLRTTEGRYLDLPESPRIAGICMVSQMEADCDWRAVFLECVEVMKIGHLSIQVMDLNQLDFMTGMSSTPASFITYLQRRLELMIIRGTANISNRDLVEGVTGR